MSRIRSLVAVGADAASAIRTRREDLDLTQSDAARLADLGLATWSAVETNARDGFVRPTLAAMSKALGWTPDSIERLARGEEPVEAAPERPAVYASTADGQVFTAAQIALIEATVHATLERIKGEQ